MGICFSVRIVNSVVFTYSLMLYVLVCFGVCLLRLLVTLFSVGDWFDICFTDWFAADCCDC